MRTWITTIKAIDPNDKELKEWCGPNIPAPTIELAIQYCQQNGLGYCQIDGELICEVDAISGKIEDFENLN